jgi:hypothetical protein
VYQKYPSRLNPSGRLVLLTLFLFMTPNPIPGDETPVGQVEKVKRPVHIIPGDGQEIIGRNGLPLFPGDQIVTGKGGVVWFSLEKGGEFRLSEDSQISVDELSGPEVEDDTPLLRLALGYLWAKIGKYVGNPVGFELHSPTAVLGVRGTEFEAVVSMDGSSVFAIDEGRVEVEAEEEKIVLDQGKMIEVEMGVKPTSPMEAIPKEQRDWHAWRVRRGRVFLQRLPQMAPRVRRRFEEAVMRSTDFTARVEETSNRLSEAVAAVRRARRDRDRQRLARSLEQLRRQVQNFRGMVVRFRRGMNRVRVLARHSQRIEQFVNKNKGRFSERELATIESNLAAISQKRVQLRQNFQQTTSMIKQNFKALRELRQETQANRANNHPQRTRPTHRPTPRRLRQN